MQIETTRFGTVDVLDSRIITFPKGLLGFSEFTNYALLQPEDDGVFFWLQSIASPGLAFIVTDPILFFPDYRVAVSCDLLDELGVDDIKDAQVFVIVNQDRATLTANLQGPLVVGVEERRAVQLVMSDKQWTTQHKIVDVPVAAGGAA